MKKNKTLGYVTLGLASALVLTACGGGNSAKKEATKTDSKTNKFSIVMVTDSGGVDDKSFNQSAWTAMKAWGEETGRKKGTDGYNNIVSTSEKDYATNFNSAIKAKYDLIYGVGYKLGDAINKVAKDNPKQNFVIVDAVISDNGKDLPNGASILFSENESSFLAGVAAAKTTKTKHVGFIGGIENEVIIRFQTGFVAGVKSVDKDIVVDEQFVGSFVDAPTATTMANAMYANGADIIYAAAGASGLGVFQSAKDLMSADESKGLYVIGVDLDQRADGEYKAKDGSTKTVTLTSSLKKVGEAMINFAKETEKDKFKSGLTVYKLKDGFVDITYSDLAPEVKTAVETAKKDVVDGKVKVPATRDELKEFLK